MDSDNEFPFESIEQFEEAVHKAIHKVEERDGVCFARVPPLHAKWDAKKIPTWIEGDHRGEEAGLKSPASRTTQQIKELQAELIELESRVMYKIEQLESLYFYLHDKIIKT